MERALSWCGSYNDFTADLLLKLPDDCKVVLAREFSPAIYIIPGKKPLPTQEEMLANEYSIEADGTVRM